MSDKPALPFAVFDEFGKGADDRVQDHIRAALATQSKAHAAELAERLNAHNVVTRLANERAEQMREITAELNEAREQLSAHDAIRAQLEAERDALRADAGLLDWIECCAMNGQIQIARSTLRTGYEIAVLDRVGPISVTVEKGTLREALAARTGSKPFIVKLYTEGQIAAALATQAEEITLLKNALWKACGDDADVVNATIESQRT